jgi:hypothetical protein
MQRRHHLNVAREVALLTRLRALRVPGVVQLLGTSECAANVYLTFSACGGGDLYARIRDGSCRARGEAGMVQEVRGGGGGGGGGAGAGGACVQDAAVWPAPQRRQTGAVRVGIPVPAERRGAAAAERMSAPKLAAPHAQSATRGAGGVTHPL